MTRQRTELEVEPVIGQFELFRASVRDDAIDVVAADPLFEALPSQASWAMLLADIFHHVVDATVEFGGLERLRTSAALREALVSISRRPKVGEVRWCARSETLPPPTDAFELVRSRMLPSGRIEMKIHGLGWGEEQYRQWAQLIYDLVHAAARLESVAPEQLKADVLAEIDRPTTTFQGGRSRISNILPRGDRSCWVSIPRMRTGLPELCRIDLSLLTRAPIDGLGLSVEFTLEFEPSGKAMLPSDDEAERLDDIVQAAVVDLTAREVVLASRTTFDAELSLLFYVSDTATATRLAKSLHDARAKRVADPSWSRFLTLRPNREELRRLANWDWLDHLAEAGRDVDGPATVEHAFWVVVPDVHERLVVSLTCDGFVLTNTSENTESGRTELIFERRLERLASSIDALTLELEAHALKAGATYDGWDVGRLARETGI